jgi:hypothetical protein
MQNKEREMNKYKKLASNTLIFAIGNFGSKILVIFLTTLYTNFISPEDMGTKENLETMALFRSDKTGILTIRTGIGKFQIICRISGGYKKRFFLFGNSPVVLRKGIHGRGIAVQRGTGSGNGSFRKLPVQLGHRREFFIDGFAPALLFVQMPVSGFFVVTK